MWDDIIYVSLLLVSIGFGKITRQIQDKQSRKWISSIFGLFILLVVSGWSTLHPLVSVLLHTLLIKFVKNDILHWVNFVFGFAYLVFFRLCGSSYIPWLPSVPSHTNAVQMIMTLKLMGLAFEVHDSNLPNQDSLEKKYKHLKEVPPLDIFHYSFAHSGILTGPYYTFRTFQDMYETPYASYIDCDFAMIKRILRVPFYVVLFLVSGYIFPLKVKYLNNTFRSRLLC